MHEDGEKIKWVNRRISTHHAVIGEVLYQPGGFAGPRWQDSFELMILHSGGGDAIIDGRSVELLPDVIYLFKPGKQEHFRFSREQETHQCWCKIKPARLPADLMQALDEAVSSVAASVFFKRLLATALEMRPAIGEAVSWEVDFMALTLFAEFLNLAEHARARSRVDDPVDLAVHHMQDHFGEATCLPGAHKAAGVSRNTLISQFQKRHHASPSRFLWKLRAERGIAMLGETGLSVAEIAYQCGFQNPFHFSRMVKQLQGVPPRDVRKQAWNMTEK